MRRSEAQERADAHRLKDRSSSLGAGSSAGISSTFTGITEDTPSPQG